MHHYSLVHWLTLLRACSVGGMCGYPDIVKSFIGLGLNLSLIIFGLFTVSYVVLGMN